MGTIHFLATASSLSLRVGPFGSVLLAAVVSTVFLSAGESRAELVDGPVDCEGLGESACVPTQKDLFDVTLPFTVSDTGAGGDPLFTVLADEEEITLQFTELVTGRDLEGVGFKLTGLESTQALAVGISRSCAIQRW